MKIAASLVLADALVSLLLMQVGMSFSEIVGDLLALEVAVLFVVAGILDFSSSVAVAQFRSRVLASKEGFSASKRKDIERRALVFVISGIALFAILVLLAVVDIVTAKS